MLLMALIGLAVLWTLAAVVVAGVCASAARGDAALRAGRQTLPRRSTWRTVRSSSFTSSQSDQLAT